MDSVKYQNVLQLFVTYEDEMKEKRIPPEALYLIMRQVFQVSQVRLEKAFARLELKRGQSADVKDAFGGKDREEYQRKEK
ncbi:hypothetical protein TNCV_230651 [Trichonephila clavipes]|nr:hypothetical protein TNCV_230651 [Trichonephila clavipes]